MNKNDIYLIHGTDYTDMTVRLLERADLSSLIGGKDTPVALKPNLVTATPPESGATTHAEVLEGAIVYLRDHGFKDVTVMEGSWAGCGTGSAFNTCGYRSVLEKYNVQFLDLKKDTFTEYDAHGMKLKICDNAMHTGFMINMPVLKGHGQTLVTCALKNNKGVIPDSEKRRYHTLGLHKPIGHLNSVCKNDFILVDNICGDLDFEEGGNPVTMNRILAFRDPVLCDAFVCATMGYEVSEVPYIGIAESLGAGSADLDSANIVSLNDPADVPVPSDIRASRRIGRLAEYAAPKDACSVCYGMLLHTLARMEDNGQLSRLKDRVCIGQGYKEKDGTFGVGSCTSNFKRSLPGCPPKAADMYRFLTTSH